MENTDNVQEVKFRRKEKPFTQSSNILIDDNKLSVQARFLYILINRWIDAPNFQIYKSALRKQMKIKSEETFDKYWRELKKAGYLIQYKFKNEKGRWNYEYDLLDAPNPVLAKVQYDSMITNNHTPKNEGVEKSPYEKTLPYTNTDLRNTNLRNTEREIREGELPSSGLSDIEITPAIIPDECKDELDKYVIGRFKKEKQFYGLNFSVGEYYNAFANAHVATQLQDNVEILTMAQYPYFLATLKKMIEPLELEKRLLGQ